MATDEEILEEIEESYGRELDAAELEAYPKVSEVERELRIDRHQIRRLEQ